MPVASIRTDLKHGGHLVQFDVCICGCGGRAVLFFAVDTLRCRPQSIEGREKISKQTNESAKLVAYNLISERIRE